MSTRPSLTQASRLCCSRWSLTATLLASLLMLAGCAGDETIESVRVEEPVAAKEPGLVSREWYPTPKHQPVVPAYVPPQTGTQQPAASGYAAPSVSQPWAWQPAQPAYVTPQPVYPVQPAQTQYPQATSVWSVPQPAVTPHSYTPQNYWYVPPAQVTTQPQVFYAPVARPWGDPVAPASPQEPAITTESWPQGTYQGPWSVPQGGTGVMTAPQPGAVLQPYNAMPTYGNVW